jgi:hypothetical protein
MQKNAFRTPFPELSSIHLSRDTKSVSELNGQRLYNKSCTNVQSHEGTYNNSEQKNSAAL